MEISENFIFYFFVVSTIVHCMWKFYLSFRQLRVYVKTTKIPPELINFMTKNSFDRTKHFVIYKRLFRIFEAVYNCVLNLIFLGVQYLPLLWVFAGKIITFFGFEPTDFVQVLVFTLVVNTLHVIARIPCGIYYHILMVHRHGFSSQTFSSHFAEQMKRFWFDLLMTIPPICGVACSVELGGKVFFIYAWILVLLATALGCYTYFEVIIPRREKLGPIPEGQLKKEVDRIASNLGFPQSKIFIANRSVKSRRSNAYFMGLFEKKRIVICDSLIKDLKSIDLNLEDDKKSRDEEEEENMEGNENQEKNDSGKTSEEQMREKKNKVEINEVLAVLCHELGHWKCNHLLKKMFFALLNLGVLLLTFSKFVSFRVFSKAFGFDDSASALLDLFVVLQMAFLPFYDLTFLLVTYLSRKFEFQSDKYAKTLGKSYYLKRALIKLHLNNLGFPVCDPLYSALSLKHPPLLERIRALDKDD